MKALTKRQPLERVELVELVSNRQRQRQRIELRHYTADDDRR